MKEIINNKCKNCAGELIFDIDSQELKCIQCSSMVDIPEKQALLEKKEYSETSTITQSKNKYTQYICSSCGRRHIVCENEQVLSCPSCGNKELEKVVDVAFVPDGIIPFKINQQKALESFKSWLKKVKFAPNNLKKLAKMQSLKGIYLPIYNYDFVANTSYSGIGVNTRRTMDGKTKTTRTRFSGNREDKFYDFAESSNSAMPSSELRTISNFNFKEVYVYRSEFLYGLIGSSVDTDIHTGLANAKIGATKDIESRIKRDSRYERVENLRCNVSLSNVMYNYLYVPVWVNSYTYNNKVYNCYINGETGKVTGKAPKSFWKIFFVLLGFLAVFGALVYFIGF